MPICKTISLNKIYQGEQNSVNAIMNCNIEINAGECVAISGSKAAGKTTLLRILGGLERPTSGEVHVSHYRISSFNDDQLAILRREEIGYLFQNDSLIPELKVHENIIMPAILAHKKYDRGYYNELVDRLHIQEFLNFYPKQLTANQMQSVIYARALINNPNIILVDESDEYPYQGMDQEFMEFLMNMVHMYHKTLIMVTNNSDNHIHFNQIIKLKNGEVIENHRI